MIITLSLTMAAWHGASIAMPMPKRPLRGLSQALRAEAGQSWSGHRQWLLDLTGGSPDWLACGQPGRQGLICLPGPAGTRAGAGAWAGPNGRTVQTKKALHLVKCRAFEHDHRKCKALRS